MNFKARDLVELPSYFAVKYGTVAVDYDPDDEDDIVHIRITPDALTSTVIPVRIADLRPMKVHTVSCPNCRKAVKVSCTDGTVLKP